MASDNPDLGEKALSKVVEVGIANQLDQVETIDVEIRTDPGKLLQGKVDSVAISGKGLVMKQDLRMETIEVTTDQVAINPLSAVFGNIELSHPTDASAKIVLTEADINRAFNSGHIQGKLQNLEMNMAGQAIPVNINQVVISLPGDNQVVISADFLLVQKNELKKLLATAVPQIEANGHRIGLKVLSAGGEGLTVDLVVAIFEQLTALLDLRNFDIPGISLQLHQLEAQVGKLVIHAKSQIIQIPSS